MLADQMKKGVFKPLNELLTYKRIVYNDFEVIFLPRNKLKV